MSNSQPAPIFVVSTGRCGSTLVSDLLLEHPEVLSISEFWPNRVNLKELFADRVMSGREYWDLLSVPMAYDIHAIALTQKTQVPKRTLHETNYIRRIALPKLVTDYEPLFEEIQQYTITLPEAKPAEHILKIFDFLKERLGKKVWVERTGANLDFLPRWKKMWPNLKAIHVYRDGRNCALSMSKHPAFKLQVLRMELNPAVSFYNIVPLPQDSFSVEKFVQTEVPLTKFGELWNKMLLKGLEELEEIPKNQRLDLSYEELVTDPRVQLKRLLDFVDPELEADDWIETQVALLHQGQSHWETLAPDQMEHLTEVCREGLTRLNYL